MMLRRTFGIGSASALLTTSTRAEEILSPVPGKRVALRGYDPVGYFMDNRAMRGMPQYWYEFDDAVYLFSNEEHRAAFIADPDHYAPQYGGFCAMSVSFGGRDEGLPDVWEIRDGKLFVFGKPDGVQDFAVDTAATIARGQANWAATHPK
jgi:hypothetical protein